MKNKIVAIVIIILVILGLTYLFSLNQAVAPAQEPIVQNTGPANLPKETDKDDVKRIMEATEKTKMDFEEARIISPNGKYKVVIDTSTEEGVMSHISDIRGNKLTENVLGFHREWSPDSTRFILYLGWTDLIYYLDIKGNYYDSGLPQGAVSASISPKDETVLYVLQEPGTNKSNLYTRDSAGKDRLILKGDNDIFAHIQWSPTGDKIAFLKSDDMKITGSDKNFLMIINSDGSNLIQVHKADWIPFMWSKDGSNITFVNNG